MKKTALILIAILFFAFNSEAQKYITKTGKIVFFSDGPLEKIEAKNNKVNSALDTKSGMFVFKVLMKSFVFEKALMQEHFNENYVESDKYPLSVFKGKITNIKDIDFTKEGSYNAEVEGSLTIHGKTNPVNANGKFIVSANNVNGKSSFTIRLADYNIEIPGVVAGKIAEEILISVDIDLKPLK